MLGWGTSEFGGSAAGSGSDGGGGGCLQARTLRGWSLESLCNLSATCLEMLEGGELKKAETEVGNWGEVNGTPEFSSESPSRMTRCDDLNLEL